MEFSSLSDDDRISLSRFFSRMRSAGSHLESFLEAIDGANEMARKLGLPTMDPPPPGFELCEEPVRSWTSAGPRASD